MFARPAVEPRGLSIRPLFRSSSRRTRVERYLDTIVVVDLGLDVSSVCSPRHGVLVEPSGSTIDPTHLDRLLRRSGAMARRSPVWVAPPPGATDDLDDRLREVVTRKGGEPFVVHRPLAAAAAMGLQIDEPACHLMAEVGESAIEVSILRSGSVMVSRLFGLENPSVVRRWVHDELSALDPDEEMDIRDRGARLFGWTAIRRAAETLGAIGLPLSGRIGRGATVLDGVRLLAGEVSPWLLSKTR